MNSTLDTNFATKYRPQSFKDVVGQESAKAVLKHIAAADGIATRAAFLRGAWGSGKCIHPSTLIRTDNGIRYAYALKHNDPFTICGCSNEIHTTALNTETTVYNISTNLGHSMKVTGNHPVLVWTGSKFDFKRADELQVNDIVCRDVSKSNFIFEFDPLAYLMGLFLGDGCITEGLTFVTTDDELTSFIKDFCDSHNLCCTFSLDTRTIRKDGTPGLPLQYTYIKKKYGKAKAWIYKYFEDEGVLYVNSHTKKLPKSFFTTWSLSQQVSLLQGVMDTDGYVDKYGRCSLEMASEDIVFGFSHVFHALGIPTSLSYSQVTYKGEIRSYPHLTCYFWTSSDYSKVFRLQRKLSRVVDPVNVSQNKSGSVVFPGMQRALAKFLDSHNIRVPNNRYNIFKVIYGLNTQIFGEENISVPSAINWLHFLKERGYNDIDFILEDVLPATVTSISTETVDYTIDVQCTDLPVFYTNGFVTHNTTLSRIFAKAMNCEHFKKDGDVCNECPECLEASSLTSQSYIECDATQMRDLASLEELKQRLSVPYKGRRVVVLDEIHAASKQVLNGLLKLVEDGVPNTIFVFCSTEDILNTIKSRSLCLDITTIPQAQMKQRLFEVAQKESIELPESIADLICTKSLGHMRDAMSYLQLYSISPDALRNAYPVFVQFFSSCFNRKQDPKELLNQLMLFPLNDIVTSLNTFLRDTFQNPEHPLTKSGKINGIFGYFYSPIAQQALKSEAGTQLLFLAFIDKTAPKV